MQPQGLDIFGTINVKAGHVSVSVMSWFCVARVKAGHVSLELFSPDGTISSIRSFCLMVEEGGKTTSCRLKEAEVYYIQAVLRLASRGTSTFRLYKHRLLSVKAVSGSVTVKVEDCGSFQAVVIREDDISVFQPQMNHFLMLVFDTGISMRSRLVQASCV